MNKIALKSLRRIAAGMVGVTVFSMTACNPEPDESDLYTFTGETIESFIKKDSSLTSFNYILSRVGYHNLLAAYGIYTCFAPVNDGVEAYCDSLYDDPEAVIPHNGMTERSLQGLTDSLCLSIARFHLTMKEQSIVSLTETVGGSVSTMLGYDFETGTDSLGRIVLNNKAAIVSSDNKATNGLIHIINNVVPRSGRMADDALDRDGRFSIFSEALKITGLADSLQKKEKKVSAFVQRPRENYNGTIYPITECKVRFTIFAEPDEVLAQHGINSLDDLIKYANEVYGKAPDWYDYMSENKLTVSTGNDYTNRFNALNMFVAYHILYAGMPVNQIVFEKSSSVFWNYVNGGEPYDYYETMLPHTILKAWVPASVGTGRTLLLNRYQTYNTLTNEVGTMGTNHEVIRRGVEVTRGASVTPAPLNGYIHPINDLLVYDRMVARGVLNERLRFNVTDLFHELANNGLRFDPPIPSQYSQDRVGIPIDYFDNIRCYDEGICFSYFLHGNWRAYQCDQLSFWGRYDYAFKLPPVPTGLYEIRIVYPPLSYGSFMQYYIGNSNSVQSMTAIGLPQDSRIDATDPRIGWTAAADEEDQGIASDVAMHNRGYMRAPHSFRGHGGDESYVSCRLEAGYGTMIIRSVLGRVQISQGTENWMRIKTLDPDNPQAIFGLDFIELVPVGIVDNQEYTEDWY